MTDDDPEKVGNPDETDSAGAAKEFLPPLDFSSLVFPFYTQALIKLGILKDPADARSAENLEFARRLIDLLDLLKERTKGNLNPEEVEFLETCLQQLRMGYLEKATPRT